MADDVAYVKQKGKAGQKPRQIYKGNRRQAVAALMAEGLSQRKIAERLGIGKSTVARDVAYLKTSEHQVRAQDTAKQIVSNSLAVIDGDIPTSLDEWRDREQANVIKLIAEKNTYEQVAIKLGISLSTVVRHVNAYLAEYGDWGGRTIQDWRNEQLIKSYSMMNRLEEEMETQPIRAYDANDDESGWELTPFQAAKIRSDARKEWMAMMQHQAKLLQLLVNKTEVAVEQKVLVMKLRGVDISSFPGQDDPIVIDA